MRTGGVLREGRVLAAADIADGLMERSRGSPASPASRAR